MRVFELVTSSTREGMDGRRLRAQWTVFLILTFGCLLARVSGIEVRETVNESHDRGEMNASTERRSGTGSFVKSCESKPGLSRERTVLSADKSSSTWVPNMQAKSILKDVYDELGVPNPLRVHEKKFFDSFCYGPQEFPDIMNDRQSLKTSYLFRGGKLEPSTRVSTSLGQPRTWRASICTRVRPNTHALVIEVGHTNNPVHLIAEYVRPLVTFASFCLHEHPSHRSKRLYVLATVPYSAVTAPTWYGTVFSALFEWIAGSPNRVWIRSRDNDAWLHLNGSVAKRIEQDANHTRPKYCFEQYSYFKALTNGPWGKYTVPHALEEKTNMTGSRWPFEVPIRRESSAARTWIEREHSLLMESVENISRLQVKGDKAPNVRETALLRYIPLQAITARVGAAIARIFLGFQSTHALPTRYLEKPTEWKSIEELGKVVRSRLQKQDRKLRILVYDRLHEKNTHFKRVWVNANATVSEFENAKSLRERIELEHVQGMPASPAEQARLFGADVIVCPHGGALGNLIFSTNALLIEGVPNARFSGKNWYYWTQLAFGHYIHPVRMRPLDLDKTEFEINPSHILSPVASLLGISAVSTDNHASTGE